MALQKIFFDAYVGTLKTGIVPERYAGKTFDYDHEQVYKLANVPAPEGLCAKMDPKDDLKSAIALYEAYPTLTPVEASGVGLWTYLTHVDLLPYMQARFNEVMEGTADKDYIRNNWFRHPKGRIILSSLSGLWWSVRLSVDETREDKYELTRMLFRNNNLRMYYLGQSFAFRMREALIGILSFLVDNRDVSDTHLNSRGKFICWYFNQLGSSRLLSYLGRSFFYDRLVKMKDTIIGITRADDKLPMLDFEDFLAGESADVAFDDGDAVPVGESSDIE